MGVTYLECHRRSWSTWRHVVLLSGFAVFSFLTVIILRGGPAAELVALLVSVMSLLLVEGPPMVQEGVMIARVNAIMRQLRAEYEAIRADIGTLLSVREARYRAAEARATEERIYALEDLEADIQSVATRAEILRAERWTAAA